MSAISSTTEIGIRELDHRSNDGIDVTLRWNARTNQVSVAVEDERLGESFELDVDPANALDAFRHPFAYADRAWDEYALAS